MPAAGPAPRRVRGADVRAQDEPGPRPFVRAVQGLGLGVVAGALAALLTPRPQRARRAAAVLDDGGQRS